MQYHNINYLYDEILNPDMDNIRVISDSYKSTTRYKLYSDEDLWCGCESKKDAIYYFELIGLLIS